MSESETKKEGDSTSSKQKLPRREWLTGFAAGGVVTAGATLGYESCEVQRTASDAPELELKLIKSSVEPLQTIDYVAEGKRRGLLAEDIQQALAGDINDYLSTTYQAFVYSELVNALPRSLRESEEVQSDIARMSPVLDQAVADAYYIIGMADDETKKEIDEVLKNDPDALMEMASGLDDDGSSRGLGLRGRLRLRRASRQLSANLKVQSTDALLAELTEQVTRYAERNTERTRDTGFGVSRAARRIMAEYQEPVRGLERWHPDAYEDPVGANPESAEPTEPSQAASDGPAEIEYQGLQKSERLQKLEDKEKRLKRAAAALAGLGGGLLIAGGIAAGVSGSYGALAPVCIGGFLLLISLFVAAALARRRRQIREERERLQPMEVAPPSTGTEPARTGPEPAPDFVHPQDRRRN